ncbi:hypothetical protein SAMN05216357_10419 [Porphyromonadaceae bacterium KH3CP3RA]|nr:hypothetical protein SAMN05216357_10419 [Porphyromonadaceae bacterium KH3CP3RA]
MFIYQLFEQMKTKQHLFNLLLFTGILLVSCNSDDVSVPVLTPGTGHTLKLTVSMPSEGNPATRVAASQKTDSKNIELRWKEGDKIQLYFKQGDNIKKGAEVTVQNFSNDGKRAEFDLSIPEGIDTANPFDLYGVHGVLSAISDNAIVLDGRASGFQPLDKIAIPIFFKAQNLTGVTALDVTFRHYGALHVVTLKNNAASRLEPKSIFLDIDGTLWYHAASEQTIPVYDMVSETLLHQAISFELPASQSLEPIASGTNTKLAQWVMPNGQNPAEFNLAVRLNDDQIKYSGIVLLR